MDARMKTVTGGSLCRGSCKTQAIQVNPLQHNLDYMVECPLSGRPCIAEKTLDYSRLGDPAESCECSISAVLRRLAVRTP